MKWVAVPVATENVTPEFLFKLAKRHKLLPENLALAVENYRHLSGTCAVIEIIDEESKDIIADVIVSGVIDGESGWVDMVPVPKFFAPLNRDGSRNEDPYLARFREALRPLLVRLIEKRGLRRLDCEIPASRRRTVKAMKACGFVEEGVKKYAIKLRDMEPDDLVILGMYPEKGGAE
jgi:hypothetical protein